MISSIIVLLIPLAIIPQATLSLGALYADNVVNYCQNEVKMFATTENKYVKKGRKPGEPEVYPTPLPEFGRIVNEIDQTQRIFECISDILNGYYSFNLEESLEYRTLVQKCVSVRPTTPQCDLSYPYRSINGSCNNLLNPRWGSALTCTRRLFPANYEGASGIRETHQRIKKLPEPRSISLKLVKPISRQSEHYNSLFALFGQAITHDMMQFISTTVDGSKVIDCCANSSNPHPQCIPILHQANDPFYSEQNISCLTIVRIAPCDSCSIGKRRQFTQVSSFIDCSLVYGQNDEKAKSLRRNDGSGKLKSQYTEADELLSPDKDADSYCGDAVKQQYCFIGGDKRTNQLTPLMIFQTLLLREHNRIADKLKVFNPHWGEEKLYQEARKILIAEFQVIIYNEYLPVLIGRNLMSKYNLSVGSGSDYDLTVNPSILIEFGGAAFRIHNLIPGKIVDDEDFEYIRSLYANAVPLYNERMSSFLNKMVNLSAKKYDQCMPKDLTNWLFRVRIGTYGFDLAAIDIQRGRDLGVPTYPQVIEYLEQRPGTIQTFDDLRNYLVPECRFLLEDIYDDVRDIDLWVGLNCEQIPYDMIISPTAAEIIAEQFRRQKYGDRFYVEHDITLTDEQRETLLNASLAKLICDNAEVSKIQPMAFLLPNIENIPQLCSTIKGVDLEKWTEDI